MDAQNVFLTGINGFLGSHVAVALIERGYRVTGMTHASPLPSLLAGTDIDLFAGSLQDPATYRDRLAACGAVIHTVAVSSFSEADEGIYERVNVTGTRLLLQAAADAGIKTFVHVGSRGTCGVADPPGDSDETLAPADPLLLDAYMRSKAAAEDLVLAAARNGNMRCTVVAPTALAGAHDEKPTPVGRIIRGAMHGRFKAYLDGGINIIDVEDAARGTVAALERGGNGERYLLGTANITLRELLGTVADIMGQQRTFVKIPYSAVYPGAAVLTALLQLLGKPSPVTPRKAYTLHHCHSYCSARKAVLQLGLPRTPLRETLEKAVRWFSAATSAD